MMKIRLKVSVKVRGGRVFTPGVYDSEIEAYFPLFAVLDLDSESDAFEYLNTPIPAPVENLPPGDLGGDGDSDEDEVIEEDEAEEEEEIVEEEEVEEKPKKKKGNKKKGK
jgi:hypothetical protein